jgi:uncharacterized protein
VLDADRHAVLADEHAEPDVDVILLTDSPSDYVERADWLAEVGAARLVRTLAWGAITERRFALAERLGGRTRRRSPAWAALGPLDAGTCNVAL